MINLKKILKIFFLLLILSFFALYFTYKNGYYEKLNEDKKILTEEMIKEYEEDLANGVDVSQKEYVVVTPKYDNSYTRFFLKLSKSIETGFDKTIKYFFKKISSYVDE